MKLTIKKNLYLNDVIRSDRPEFFLLSINSEMTCALANILNYDQDFPVRCLHS